jgi:protein-tyrosine kinase
MSHIFDALQRSETERTGTELPPLAGAAELLQIAEQEAAEERERIACYDSAIKTEAVAEARLPEVSTNGPHFAQEEISAQDAGVDQFYRLPTIRASVTSESRLVCLTGEESLAAEKFRFVGVRLRQLQRSRTLKKVLVTSTIPKEGKSTVAANLACILARRTQQKVLLIDGDLRRPSQAPLFGLGEIPGISEWLQDGAGPMTIYRLEGPGCWILPSGSAPSNPLELIQSAKLPALMDQLTAWFDWIVIDSPPVLPLADTSIWIRQADGVLLVTRQGITERQQLSKGLELIEPSKLIGTILNGTSNTAHNNYYYQYSRPVAEEQADRSGK